jgi:AcrR family transcriptional regulator
VVLGGSTAPRKAPLPPADVRAMGLRERKKARTRGEIQARALHLFRQQGYEATTVQQIIEEAEVSESTFFRYFPTKADVVLSDEFDPVIVEAFRSQPRELSAVPALRAAFQVAFSSLTTEEKAEQRDRMALILSVPELRGAMLDQFASAMHLLAEIVAERAGQPVDDIQVRTVAGAVVGVALAVMFVIAKDPSLDMAAELDRSMERLEAGLDL